MTNSIAYLLNNSKKSLKTVHGGGASLVFTWSAVGGWCCCCLRPLPAAPTDTARPAYTNTLHRRTTINVLCLIKDSNELITME